MTVQKKKRPIRKSKTKSAELHLPYHKQGDDLAHCQNDADNAKSAMLSHAAILTEAAGILKTVASRLSDTASIDADCHYISITDKQEIIDSLVNEGVMADQDSDSDGPGLVPGYCALCRAKEIELYGTVLSGAGPKHTKACKDACCLHPAHYDFR
jgi:hypothetical protein